MNNIHQAIFKVTNIFFLKINFSIYKKIDINKKKINKNPNANNHIIYFLSYLKYIKLPYKMWQPPKPNAQNNKP